MTWGGVATIHHRRYVTEIVMPINVKTYAQSLVLKKTLESISLDRRRDNAEDEAAAGVVDEAVMRLAKNEREAPSIV